MKGFTAVVRSITLLCAGVVAGAGISGWAVFNPILRSMPGAQYVAFHQAQASASIMRLPMTLALVGGVLLGLLLLRRDSGRAGYLVLAGAALSTAVALISVLGNVPLNQLVEGWNALQLPSDWAAHRDAWMTFHSWRTLAAAGAFAAHVAAAVSRER
jgi:hypothetical protein